MSVFRNYPHKMKKLLILALLVAYTSASVAPKVRSSFGEYEKKFAKKYKSDAEREFRIKVFAENLAKIEAHNAKKSNSWFMKVTQFADMTGDPIVSLSSV